VVRFIEPFPPGFLLFNFHFYSLVLFIYPKIGLSCISARLAQSVERQTLNLVVAGSSPAVGCSPKERQYFFRAFNFFIVASFC
jgi:hypothetical protein